MTTKKTPSAKGDHVTCSKAPKPQQTEPNVDDGLSGAFSKLKNKLWDSTLTRFSTISNITYGEMLESALRLCVFVCLHCVSGVCYQLNSMLKWRLPQSFPNQVCKLRKASHWYFCVASPLYHLKYFIITRFKDLCGHDYTPEPREGKRGRVEFVVMSMSRVLGRISPLPWFSKCNLA